MVCQQIPQFLEFVVVGKVQCCPLETFDQRIGGLGHLLRIDDLDGTTSIVGRLIETRHRLCLPELVRSHVLLVLSTHSETRQQLSNIHLP